MLCMLKSKIRDLIITDVNLDYEGSIAIDETLLKRANIFRYEQVDVVNFITETGLRLMLLPVNLEQVLFSSMEQQQEPECLEIPLW